MTAAMLSEAFKIVAGWEISVKNYLLFDLDGTLTDPKIGITTCVQYALKSFGIEEPDLDKLTPFIGPPLNVSFREFYGMDEEKALQAVKKYRERFATEGLYENEVYEGIPSMLKILKNRGAHMAIASSKPTVFVEKILEHFHIKQYFEVIVGSELDGTRSNKDEVVDEAIKQLFSGKEVEKEKIFMIGDRKFDVEGAKALGIESVGVAYGYGGIEELKAAKADYVVRTVEELQGLLLRGFEESKSNATRFQKIWAILYNLLLFLMTKNLTQMASYGILSSMKESLPKSWLVVSETGEITGFTGNVPVGVTAFGYIVAAAVIFKTAKYIIGRTKQEMYLTHLKEEPGSSFVYAVFVFIGGALGLNLLFHLLGFTDLFVNYRAMSESSGSANIPFTLLCYGVIAALSEELLFRGILYGYIRRFTNIRIGIIGSAVLYGMYHGNMVESIYAVGMGLLFAYCYEYFGDILAVIAFHIIANIVAYLVTYFGGAVPVLASWPVCGISLLLAGGCLFLLFRRKKVF